MKEEKQEGKVTYRFADMRAARINTMLFLRGIFLAGAGAGFIIAIISKFSESPVAFSIALLFCSLLFFAGVRMILKTFDKEYIVISPESLTIFSRQGFKQQKKDYLLSGITELAYKGADKTTDHPLTGKSIDYMGFEARDREIDAVNKTGNIGFEYGGKQVLFGRDVYSWDARKISDALYEFSVGNLQMRDLPQEIPEMTYKFSTH